MGLLLASEIQIHVKQKADILFHTHTHTVCDTEKCSYCATHFSIEVCLDEIVLAS